MGFPEQGKPEGSGETRQEPAAPATVAEENGAGPGAMAAKSPPRPRKRIPWGALVTRSAANRVGKQGAVRRSVQEGH